LDIRLLCPCGSNVDYVDCCKPYHSGEKSALTAEALMRSRFSAYALDDTAYIIKTWAGSVQPEKIDFSKEPIEWSRLEIVGTKKGGIKDSKGIVEFKAYYIQNAEELVLHEASRFIKTNGRWLYLDGVVKSVGKIIPQSNEGKNAPCSCGSGKKYKRCCGAA
jgi:SEC-C motif domain protein